MINEKDIESIKIIAGKRTYFVDVNETREGAKYLKITETKRFTR